MDVVGKINHTDGENGVTGESNVEDALRLRLSHEISEWDEDAF